ncbi:hypothetical protein [Roseateles sp.]|uniref:hypothetical protein n=1 Tax=Roseateles sp. TaxID=1971397 RepID=UPI0039E759B5
MNPAWLFPLLALAFAAAALLKRWHSGAWRGAASTWLLMALIFGGIGLWLNRGA